MVRFNRANGTLEFCVEGGEVYYDYEMERANTPERLLSLLFHLCGKNWGTPQFLGAIIHILDAVIPAITNETAEHIYCYQVSDHKKPNGFDWKNWLKSEKRKAKK